MSFLAGKRDSRLVAKTSPRNVSDLVILESQKVLAIIIQTIVSSLLLTKSKMKLPIVYLFLVLRLELEVKSRIRSLHALESKGF